MESGIGNRLKNVREYFSLNQRDFSEKIGISQPGLAMFEKEDRELKNIHIKRICDEFGVNEVWLRTGEGGDKNMFTQVSPDDRYSISLGKLTMTENEFIQNAINALAETEPEKLKIIEEFMKKCLNIK